MAKLKHEVPVDVENALVDLVDVCIVLHYDHRSEETLTECRCCGEWEGHTDVCPMPAIGRWIEAV